MVGDSNVFGTLSLGLGSKLSNYSPTIPLVETGKFGIIRLAGTVVGAVGFARIHLPLAFRRS
jgi:hypothetical protein